MRSESRYEELCEKMLTQRTLVDLQTPECKVTNKSDKGEVEFLDSACEKNTHQGVRFLKSMLTPSPRLAGMQHVFTDTALEHGSSRVE